MKIRYGHLFTFGASVIFLSLLSKFILDREKREELKYWLEYHKNKLGTLETEKHRN